MEETGVRTEEGEVGSVSPQWQKRPDAAEVRAGWFWCKNINKPTHTWLADFSINVPENLFLTNGAKLLKCPCRHHPQT